MTLPNAAVTVTLTYFHIAVCIGTTLWKAISRKFFNAFWFSNTATEILSLEKLSVWKRLAKCHL